MALSIETLELINTIPDNKELLVNLYIGTCTKYFNKNKPTHKEHYNQIFSIVPENEC